MVYMLKTCLQRTLQRSLCVQNHTQITQITTSTTIIRYYLIFFEKKANPQRLALKLKFIIAGLSNHHYDDTPLFRAEWLNYDE